MKKLQKSLFALLLLTASYLPLMAQVSYNRCWSDCHDLAMMVLERYGMMDAAVDTFNGCMEMC